MTKTIRIVDVHRMVGLFLFCFGLFWTLTGIFIFNAQKNSYNRLSKEGFMATAVISRIEETRDDDDDSTSHDVYVTFTARNRIEITTKLNYYNSSMREGSRIEIYYDPSNPADITTAKDYSYMFLLVFCGIGLPFLAAGIILIRKSSVQRRKKEMLISYGDYIMADVTEVYQNSSVKLFRGRPSIMRLEYYENGVKHDFKSQNFFYSSELPDKLRVWVDRSDYSNYHVDLESLGGENDQ